jgi:hypothetical protein
MEDTPSCRSITFLSHDREEGEEAGSGRAARREAGIAKEKESLLNGPPFFLRSPLTQSEAQLKQRLMMMPYARWPVIRALPYVL